MFKKPTCPYCKAIYDYKEIKEQKNNETVICHNCKKAFQVKKTAGLILLDAVTFLFAAAFNIFLLEVVAVNSGITLIVITVVIFYISLFFKPFFVKYKKKNNEEEINTNMQKKK